MSHQDWIVQTLEAIRDDLAEMKAILAVNTRELETHIKRTNMLEEQVKLLDKDVTKLRGFFSIAGWILGICATVLTILTKLGRL